MTQYLHEEVTSVIIESFYRVYNTLGYGFLERVYENAMKIELIKRGKQIETQSAVKVWYEGESVGEYFPDVIVDRAVIVEIKTAKMLLQEHEAQLVNYLRAADIEVGLLVNFGVKPQIRRKILTNDRKKSL